MLPPSVLPVLLIKLIIPPGEFDDNVEAEPPRMASIFATFLSNLVKISAVPNEISPYNNTGNPSSWSCTYLDPPDEIGTPRTAMFEFPSPPEDSERIPGIVLKISAVERGADCSICLALIDVMETLDFSLVFGFTTPVITTSSSCSFLIVSCSFTVSFCENVKLNRNNATKKIEFFKNLVISFILKFLLD